MLATVAEGEFATLADAAGALVQLGEMYEPEPANRSHYDEAYARYGETFSALQAVRSLN
jgi:sugar (pentulose or hexulose) kinase